MKILAITASDRKKGNSELAVKYIAKKLNANLEILRLTKMKIEPCKACYACLYGKKCEIDDDVYEILTKIEESDAVIISSPVYFLDATSKLKALLDRAFLALPYMDSFSGKKCVVLTHHGFAEGRGWASATHLMLARAFCLNVLANVEIHATLPAEVVAKKENVEKLDLAAKILLSGEKYVADGQCPVCLNTVFRHADDKLICPLCLSELDKELKVLKEGKWWLSREWFKKHFFKELLELKEEFKKRREELERAAERLL
ncbi:flavodoxin family protein [Archaeoglobales archaeon]|nr:MAG: flavodoxin family protein [Archaeoglobales archaeon]